MFQRDFESYTAQFIADNTSNATLKPKIQPRINDANEESVSTIAQLLLKLGVLYWRRGDYDRSELLLTKVHEISSDTQDAPFLAQCFIGLGLVKTSLEKIDDAITAYKQAIRLEPENFHLWNNLGNLYLQHQQPDEALSAFKQSIHGNSNDATAWNGLAAAHYQKGKVDEAIHAYKRAIKLLHGTVTEQFDRQPPELNKHLAIQWFHLAMLYTKKCQYQKAVDAYQNVLTFAPGNAEIWYELGELYLKLEAHEKSFDAFSKVIELNPEHGEAHKNLAYVYTKLGNCQNNILVDMKSIERLPSQRERKLASDMQEESMCLIRKDNIVNPFRKEAKTRMCPSSHNEVTWFYYKYNEEMTSINLSHSVSKPKKFKKRTNDRLANKKHANTIDVTSTQQTKIGERDMPRILPLPLVKPIRAKIEDSFVGPQNLKFEITDPYVWNEKGNLHFKSKEYKDATISYKKAIEIDPTFGQPYNNLALIQSIQGNYNESIVLYQKSVILLTTDQEKAIAWNELGNVYRCIKDYKSARIAYQNASELDKLYGGVYDSPIVFEVSEEYKTADFWKDLGKLLFKTGGYEKAALAFQEAIRLEPSAGNVYGYLARALSAQGQYLESIFLYRKSIELLSTDKEKADAWNRLGDVHRKLNDYDNALKAYQNATALSKDKFNLLSRTRFSLLSNCAAK